MHALWKCLNKSCMHAGCFVVSFPGHSHSRISHKGDCDGHVTQSGQLWPTARAGDENEPYTRMGLSHTHAYIPTGHVNHIHTYMCTCIHVCMHAHNIYCELGHTSADICTRHAHWAGVPRHTNYTHGLIVSVWHTDKLTTAMKELRPPSANPSFTPAKCTHMSCMHKSIYTRTKYACIAMRTIYLS
jgi:hypothetical protein